VVGDGGSSSKPTTNVTALTLQKISNCAGPCPAHLKMVGTITTDGLGTVFYEFGAGNFDPTQTITSSAARDEDFTRARGQPAHRRIEREEVARERSCHPCGSPQEQSRATRDQTLRTLLPSPYRT